MFKKGESGNPTGRPDGSKNKSTEELRNTVQSFIENNIESMQANFDKLDAKDKLMFIEKILSYTLPKLKLTELKTEPENLQRQRPILIFKDLNEPDDEELLTKIEECKRWRSSID